MNQTIKKTNLGFKIKETRDWHKFTEFTTYQTPN